MLRGMFFCGFCDWELMDTPTKSRVDATKNAAKRVVRKAAEAKGDLIGNKITDKITSLRQKVKRKKKKMKQIKDKEFTYHQKKAVSNR